MELEYGNTEVKSSIKIVETDMDLRLILKDCENTITWRFRHKNKEQIIKSIIKSERAIVEIQRLQEMLKQKILTNDK